MRLESLVGGSSEIVGPEMTLVEAAKVMVGAGADCLAVVDRRNLVGLFTERDLVRAVAVEAADVETETVGTWMTEAPDTFSPDVDTFEAAKWLLEAGYRHLPVVADGELHGVVGIRDLLIAIAGDN